MTQQEQSIGAVTWRRIIAILRFPALLAIVLPLALLVTFHQGTSHKLRHAAVADDSRVRLLADEPHRRYPRGFAVLGWRTPAAAAAGVRAGEIAGAHIAGSADTIHVARADYAIDARYVQGVFTRFAAATGGRAPRDVDFESQASGDGGIGIFFLVFPVMMAGAITTIVLLRRPTWGVGRRVALVAGVGAVSAVGAYRTAVGLQLLPGKPVLLAYTFLLTQLVSAQNIARADRAALRGSSTAS